MATYPIPYVLAKRIRDDLTLNTRVHWDPNETAIPHALKADYETQKRNLHSAHRTCISDTHNCPESSHNHIRALNALEVTVEAGAPGADALTAELQKEWDELQDVTMRLKLCNAVYNERIFQYTKQASKVCLTWRSSGMCTSRQVLFYLFQQQRHVFQFSFSKKCLQPPNPTGENHKRPLLAPRLVFHDCAPPRKRNAGCTCYRAVCAERGRRRRRRRARAGGRPSRLGPLRGRRAPALNLPSSLVITGFSKSRKFRAVGAVQGSCCTIDLLVAHGSGEVLLGWYVS